MSNFIIYKLIYRRTFQKNNITAPIMRITSLLWTRKLLLNHFTFFYQIYNRIVNDKVRALNLYLSRDKEGQLIKSLSK